MKTFYLLTTILIFTYATNAQVLKTELAGLDHEWVSPDQLKGETLTVLDFWATWCKPCLNSIPELNSLYLKYKNQGVNFIGINTDAPRNRSKVKPMVNALGLDYPVLLDPDGLLMNDLNISGLPTLIIFDNKGKRLYFHEGFKEGDEKIIGQKIENLLSE